MTGIVKTDQLQGAQGTTVTVPTGHTLAVTSNATVGGTAAITGNTTVGGTLGVTGTLTTAAITSTGRHDVNFNGAGTQAFKYTDTGGGNLAGFGQFYNPSNALIGNIQNANNDGIHLNIKNGSIVFGNVGYTAANALDEYEEGTWTPQLTDGSSNIGTTVPSGYSAIYTRIGRIVHLEFYIQKSDASSNTSPMILAGLPFSHYAIPAVVGQVWIDNSSQSDLRCFLYLPINYSQFYFIHSGSASGYVTPNEFDNGRYMYGALTYHV